MELSRKGLLAIVSHEAVVLSTYHNKGDVATIGVGHTSAAGPPDPSLFRTSLTLEEALTIFQMDLKRYVAEVVKAIKMPIKQEQFDALVSFHFNTGAIARAEITKAVNRGAYSEAGQLFMNWTTPKSVTARRRSEQVLFLKGVYPDISRIPVYDQYPGPARLVSTESLKLTSETLVVSPPPVIAVSSTLKPAPAPRQSFCARVFH